MESGMVRHWSDNNCHIVERFFVENFPLFQVKNKYTYAPYWNIVLCLNEVEIKIGGDIGFSIDIFIDKTEYPLWRYDRSVVDKTKTTEDNILFQLNVLKQFLNDVGF